MTPSAPPQRHSGQLPVSGGVSAAPEDEPFPGVTRTSYQTAEATVASYRFAPGAEFPLHHHREEQITVICEGEVEFLVAGKTHRLGAGETFVVEPHVEHGLRAGDAGARFLAVVVPRRARTDAYTIS
jgi:quercetin dioxygenase-like cupin family protein